MAALQIAALFPVAVSRRVICRLARHVSARPFAAPLPEDLPRLVLVVLLSLQGLTVSTL